MLKNIGDNHQKKAKWKIFEIQFCGLKQSNIFKIKNMC